MTYNDFARTESELFTGDDIIHEFVDDMLDEGLRVDGDSVRWSGFYSQGDGASFDAVPSWDFWLKALDPPEPWMAMAEREGLVETNVTASRSHYCHANTMHGDYSTYCSNLGTAAVQGGIYDGVPYRAIRDNLGMVDIEENVTFLEQYARRVANELYDRLEKAYSYAVSRESYNHMMENQI